MMFSRTIPLRDHFISCFIRLENGVAFVAWTLEQLQFLMWMNTCNQSHIIGTADRIYAHETTGYEYYHIDCRQKQYFLL